MFSQFFNSLFTCLSLRLYPGHYIFHAPEQNCEISQQNINTRTKKTKKLLPHYYYILHQLSASSTKPPSSPQYKLPAAMSTLFFSLTEVKLNATSDRGIGILR